ncbi:hypothetical protein ADL22_24300 [Streptomyces sp. NRRL F-4489]|nr:hypothetical protein ADL22_24300 [Streptomyces sp. NRRL F-4489]
MPAPDDAVAAIAARFDGQPAVEFVLGGRQRARAARAARTVKACEAASPGMAAGAFAFVALACFAPAVGARTAAGAVFPCVVGVLLLVVAALTPRCTRRVHERDLRLLEDFRRQQAARFPVPPPGPAPSLRKDTP